MNNAELTPSLSLYAIHSKNAELIHLIKSNEVPLPKSQSKKKSSIIDQCLICAAADKNEIEVVYHFWLRMHKISKGFLDDTKQN